MRLVILSLALNLLAATPGAAQQQIPDTDLLARLEKKLAQSESNAKRLTGGPKLLWLLRHVKIEKMIGKLKAGQLVDSKEIDIVLKGQVN